MKWLTFKTIVRRKICSNIPGILPLSQISRYKIEKVEDVLSLGDTMFCKIISIEGKRVSLSIKHIQQGDGTDLDPNNVGLELERRRQKPKISDSKDQASKADAIYNTKCQRCGGEGHLSNECFSAKGDQGYALIKEEDLIPKKSRKREKSDKTKKKSDEKAEDTVFKDSRRDRRRSVSPRDSKRTESRRRSRSRDRRRY
ncbi:hypothetical protein O9G_001374 [Rozella allomycis CSF55]|uniref:CCHC-type domain-containing protein n=1 Tax=Rozella allomycis (strain CSF55) TaxID=988480 RepID=A0A075B558_ROZAC|nr:hypothetical protein O9G_001374 [Rozella allomycis CSF55]|eukprot:EPZ36929.1 hypothetical protein O9G_001374 [Rozella allomycis CSF55]